MTPRHQAIMVRKVCANMLFLLKWSIEKNYKHSVVNQLLNDTERGDDDFTVQKANNYFFKQYSTYTFPCLVFGTV